MSHIGGDAVADAKSTAIPASPSLSMMRSSQSKSYTPSLVSIFAHEKMPTDTRFTPAFFIRRTSSSHTSSGHWSGL